ncbi:MAG: hypothetical protein CMN93_07810 [Synechococcus sp. CPC35]|nr:hypothetical protein [Synechococcus sp. CPC35]
MEICACSESNVIPYPRCGDGLVDENLTVNPCRRDLGCVLISSQDVLHTVFVAPLDFDLFCPGLI